MALVCQEFPRRSMGQKKRTGSHKPRGPEDLTSPTREGAARAQHDKTQTSTKAQKKHPAVTASSWYASALSRSRANCARHRQAAGRPAAAPGPWYWTVKEQSPTHPLHQHPLVGCCAESVCPAPRNAQSPRKSSAGSRAGTRGSSTSRGTPRRGPSRAPCRSGGPSEIKDAWPRDRASRLSRNKIARCALACRGQLQQNSAHIRLKSPVPRSGHHPAALRCPTKYQLHRPRLVALPRCGNCRRKGPHRPRAQWERHRRRPKCTM
mmetsp:Transcript_99338/g.303750  ORF Transcript_99338/g.303750 Transcript_99338/m.303750 type:complete len:264 (+) Transcript_99338:85-876(+)